VDPISAVGIAKSAQQPTEAGQSDKAAEGFEAIFLRQILRQFRASVSIDGEKSSMSGLYTDMFDDQLAEHLAGVGTLGLKDVVKTYLTRSGQ